MSLQIAVVRGRPEGLSMTLKTGSRRFSALCWRVRASCLVVSWGSEQRGRDVENRIRLKCPGGFRMEPAARLGRMHFGIAQVQSVIASRVCRSPRCTWMLSYQISWASGSKQKAPRSALLCWISSMSSSSATAADSRSPSPHTPDPSDSSQPVVVQADIDAAASWFIPMHHSQSKQPPWGSASAVFPPHKLEDDQILRIDDLLEQHAFDEYASSYRSLSPVFCLFSDAIIPKDFHAFFNQCLTPTPASSGPVYYQLAV